MEREELVSALESLMPDPSQGLPEDVFLFVSRVTPLVNVDLLIQDAGRRTLLTWRDDGLSPAGWHVPGGIIRYKETAAARILEVARGELQAEVAFDPVPLAINELIHPTQRTRGHFISLLYRCRLTTTLAESSRFQPGNPIRDAWMWHAAFPEEMIPAHGIYRSFF
jgi:colanic acid biosynthesis protein WcaH